jgi:hypothetical protein
MNADQLSEEPMQAGAEHLDDRPRDETKMPRRGAHRLGRHAVLAIPLVLVNAAAVYGQVQWATANLADGRIGFAVLFALTVESIAVYLAYEAHAALLAGDASLRLRVASYLAAGLVGALNYSHFAGSRLQPTATALVFGGLSSISPWLWSIRSRSLRRDQLRSAGLIDPRSAHFAAAKWVNFPIRTLRAYRWSIDHGVPEERAAWEAYRASQQSRRAGRQGQLGVSRGRRSIWTNGRPAAAASPALGLPSSNGNGATGDVVPGADVNGDDLLQRVRTAVDAGERVTGATVGQWLGVSPRTGRRRLSQLIKLDPSLADAATEN